MKHDSLKNRVYKPHEIIIENVIMKKTISAGNNVYNVPIKYLLYDLIIQTPIMYIPFGINKFNNKSYIDISFLNISIDKEMIEFYNIITNINNSIKSYITLKKKYIGREFINSIKKNTDIYPKRLRLSINDTILVVDDKKQNIS